MSDANMDNFYKRLERIDHTHRKFAKGYETVVLPDGLIVARPRRSFRAFPWRGLLMVLVCLVLFKSLLLAQVGPDEYAERITRLESGTFAERAGAYVLRPDAVTALIADQVRPYFQ